MIYRQCDMCQRRQQRPLGGPPDRYVMIVRDHKELDLCQFCASDYEKHIDEFFLKKKP